MITVTFGTGQALAPWLGGALRDSSGSFTLTFTVAAASALLGAVAAVLLREPKTAVAEYGVTC